MFFLSFFMLYYPQDFLEIFRKKENIVTMWKIRFTIALI